MTGALWTIATAGQEPQAGAADPGALLPEPALAVLELADAGALVAGLERMVLPLPGELAQVGGPLLGAALVALQATLGCTPQELASRLVPERAALALVPGPGRLEYVLVSRVPATAELQEILVRAKAVDRVALADGWLIAASTPALREAALARRLAVPRRAVAALPPGELRLVIDLAHLRGLQGPGAESLWGRLDAGGRLLVGPLAAAIDRAERAELRLTIRDRLLRVTGTLHGGAAGGEHPGTRLVRGKPIALPPLPAGTLARLVLDRDLGWALQHLDAVFRAEDVARIRSGFSIAEALLGGTSVADELAPALGPLVLHVLSREDAAGAGPRPRVVLPGFVFSAEVGQAQATAALRKGFRSLATIHNAERVQRGEAPYRPTQQQVDAWQLLVLEEPEWLRADAPPTAHQFSPTLLCAHGHVILASDRTAALQLARALGEPRQELVPGDAIRLAGGAIARYLAANTNFVRLARMLDEGESALVAGRFTQGLIAAVAASELEFEWAVDGQAIRAELRLRRQP